MAKCIYLDNHTTTPIKEGLLKEIEPFFTKYWAAPGTPYAMGAEPLEGMKKSYSQIYKALSLDDDDIFVFTSSGAEAINHVILSTYFDVSRQTGRNHFITSNIEEAPMIMSLERLFPLGCSSSMVPVNENGIVTLKALEKVINPRTVLFSLSWSNGLTGVVNPLEEIAALCKDRNILFHLDVTYCLGKEELDFSALPVDILTFKGECIHAPKGTGGLALRKHSLDKKGLSLGPFILGGGQQVGWRAGVVNVPFLVALGSAMEEMCEQIDFMTTEVVRLRMKLEEGVCKQLPETQLLFTEQHCLPNCCVLGFPGIESEALLYLLDQKGVCASIGGGDFQKLSLLLEASGIDPIIAGSAISFALSRETTDEDIDHVIAVLPPAVQQLQKLSSAFFTSDAS